MQQRRLRLGDILDDYCPRERRVTNHAVVAMVDNQVKQTRCTTCDADHVYKQARVPGPRKKKKDAAAPAPGAVFAPQAAKPDDQDVNDDMAQDDRATDSTPHKPLGLDAADAQSSDPLSAAEPLDASDSREDGSDDDGPVHRQLIRATLPRPEGQAPEWKDPEFTVRQPDSNKGREFGAPGDGHRPGGGRNRRPMRAGQGAGQPGPQRFGGPRDRNARQGGDPNRRQSGNGDRQGHPGGQRGGGLPGQGDHRGPGRKRGPR